MPKILDNIEEETAGELLRTLGSSYRLDAAIGYFNLRGWKLLAEAVDALPERPGEPKARILVGIHEAPAEEMRRLARMHPPDPIDTKTAARLKGETIAEYREQLQVGIPTSGDEESLRTLLRQIEAGHVEVRVHLAHRLHAKLYLCHRDDSAAPRVGYVGSSNLSAAGLQEQGELNVDVVDGDATSKLAAWFEDRWNDLFTIPAVPELINTLRESWASEEQLDPYLVYLKMAYHLSKEARDGLIQYGLPASMQDTLLDFQAAAVKIAARIVMQKGGAMIGDVVGLGKTLVGTAVARLLQEEQGFETLVVCPKNLTQMWESYLHTYEVRGTVESLSMVHKTLPEARRYRLVIVDEAHNLRTDTRRDHQVLKDYIAANDSRTLLLTATPYNKQFGDLASQLALFIRPDDDLGLRPELTIAEMGAVRFETLCEGRTSTLAAFKRSEHLGDWQALMSQYLVRRTRRFVEDNYALVDEDGRRYLTFGTGKRFYFPQRTAVPVERVLAADDPAAAMASDMTLDAIRDLLLPRYRLRDYINDNFVVAEKHDRKLIDDLRKAGQGNLEGFTRVGMFKRLSSSGPAFVATLRRHRLRNQVAAHAMDNGLPVPIGSVDNDLWRAETDQDPADADNDVDTADAIAGDILAPVDTVDMALRRADTDQEPPEDDEEAVGDELKRNALPDPQSDPAASPRRRARPGNAPNVLPDSEPEPIERLHHRARPGSTTNALGGPDSEPAAVAYEKLRARNPAAIRWAPPGMFAPELADDLRRDNGVISGMLNRFGDWDPTRDGKLAELGKLLTETHPDEKVLIFTEAADTANYVWEELLRRGIERVGIVTGDSENPTALAQRFSPRSSSVGAGSAPVRDELRVLVSTDVLSEGQNLQDAHIVVNYDLPWAIVKLVQRAGRVDRIGQTSPQVLVYSLLPAKSVEEEIALRARIRARLGLNAQLLGSDEAFFGDPSERRIVAGVYDEASEQLTTGIDEVDPVSMAYEIWRHATDNHPDLAERVATLPNIVYSTKAVTPAQSADTTDAPRTGGAPTTGERAGTGSGTSPAGRPDTTEGSDPDKGSAAGKNSRTGEDSVAGDGLGSGAGPGTGVLVHTQTVTGADAFAFVEPGGQARRVTPQEALRMAECTPDTPAVKRLEDHHDLTAAALGGPLHTPPGRATGALQGIRGKVWNRLHDFMQSFEGNLFVAREDLAAAHDAINERPLYESATQCLAHALRDRQTEDLAELVTSLHKDNLLCLEPTPEGTPKDPQIVCTLGLRHMITPAN